MPKQDVKYCTCQELQKMWEKWQEKSFVGYVMMADTPLDCSNNLWCSDPITLPDWETIHQNHNFIWEANLYEPDKQSISISQMDSKWQVITIDWEQSEQPEVEFQEQKYLIAVGDTKIVFKQAWAPQKDALCANMEVLRPSWRAFVGFES